MGMSGVKFFVFLTSVLSASFCTGEYTDAQKKELLDKHNHVRGQQGAAGMNELVWDETIAHTAQSQAGSCSFKVGLPSIANIQSIGQLIYMATGHSDPVSAFDMWNGEAQYFDKETHACQGGKDCGSYRMLVHDAISKVGCGFKVCPDFTKSDGTKLADVTFAVCLYDNAPPQKGPVFTSGAPCSKCPAGNFWCNNNMCQPTCREESDKCQCHAKYDGVCQNCGTYDKNACTCKCADGYYGKQCTETCEDIPGTWRSDMREACTPDVMDDPEFFCTDLGASCCPYIRTRTCKATCAPFTGLCTPLTDALKKKATTGCTLTKPKFPQA